MKVSGRIIAITGGGSGLGAEACRIARDRGAKRVAVVDRDADAARAVAAEIGGEAFTADVTDEARIRDVVEQLGEVDIWVHNAGIGVLSSPFTENAIWQRMWEVHVMAVVYAARALLPAWLERGEGHMGVVASANALTTNPTSVAYAATKHAELAVTEWLAMTYASRGVTASCFCPKGMLTPLLLASADSNEYARDSIRFAVTPQEAGRSLIDLIESGGFLSTTYPPILEDYRLRATDPEAFLAQMAQLHDTMLPGFGGPEGP